MGEDEPAGGRRTRIGSRRLSPSRRFKPSQPLQNSNPVHLRRQQEVGQVQPGQVQEQAEQSWLPPKQSVRPQQEEKRRFYNEQQQEEQRFNYQPLTERLGGQRNPLSSF